AHDRTQTLANEIFDLQRWNAVSRNSNPPGRITGRTAQGRDHAPWNCGNIARRAASARCTLQPGAIASEARRVAGYRRAIWRTGAADCGSNVKDQLRPGCHRCALDWSNRGLLALSKNLRSDQSHSAACAGGHWRVQTIKTFPGLHRR